MPKVHTPEDNNQNGKKARKSSELPKVRKAGKQASKKKSVVQVPETVNLHLRPTIINEVKLLVSVESPSLKFSKKFLKLLIEATPTQENYIVEGDK